MERRIKNANLHKRIAVMESNFMGSHRLVHLGNGIVGVEKYVQFQR